MSTEMQTHLSALNKDPRAVRSRQALHQALLHLLEVKPLDQITIRDITKKASVGYTTFFRHHPTKEALLDDVAAEQINALFSLSLPVMEAHDLRTASVALLTYVDEHRPLWSTLLTGGAAGTIRDEFLRQARQVAASQSPRKSRMPAELGVALIVSGVIELLAWWLESPIRYRSKRKKRTGMALCRIRGTLGHLVHEIE